MCTSNVHPKSRGAHWGLAGTWAALALALCALAWPTRALAQQELDELENPGSVSAVQERLYRMNHELDLGIGLLPLDAFYKGLTVQVGYTYHFTDSFAWQVGRGLYSYNVDTGLRTQLERDYGVQPTAFEEVQWMVGSDLVWSPFYGKTAFLNRKVLHFTGFLSIGGSVLKMNNTTGAGGFRPALALGLGGRLFSGKHLSFRLDLTDNVVVGNRIFNVPTIQLSTALNFGATE